ncbi:MAG TPA: hypothetical protein VKM94_20415 [Blastocatellia bacterium]|nr:hypothetical protein [Blastocatellia bacterium]
MQINPNTGFFDVQPGELITITVCARNTHYLASFPDAPSCTAWTNIQGPAAGCESRQFIAPAAGECFVVITFDFESDQNGSFPDDAEYDVNVKGTPGISFDDDPVTPPPVVARQYRFHVI